MSARVTTVSAFPDIGGMSAYPDFSLIEDDLSEWEAGITSDLFRLMMF